jgi:arylsulfatase A-like enzyme
MKLWILALLLASSPAALAAGRRPNVLIFAVDGLRADHLGTFGYRRQPTSPNLDRWAAKAFVFGRAESQASWTLPSFASMFTSRYPHQHGAIGMNRKLGEGEVLLPQVFQKAGYKTGGFVGGPFINPEYGFSRGFDVYNAGGARMFRETVPPAIEWLRKNKDKPFFLFIHGNDVHPPFNPDLPEAERRRFDPGYKGPANDLLLDYYFVKVYNRYPWQAWGPPPDAAYKATVEKIRSDPKSVGHIVSLYDSQIADVDESFEKVLRELDRDGVASNTIVVVMADHGLEMNERGLLCTGFHTTLYETITHVPLAFSVPGRPAGRSEDPAELVDIAPTLVELAGLEAPKTFVGESLVPLMDGRHWPDRVVFGASTVVGSDGPIPEFYARQGPWKLIYDVADSKSELYNLDADPGEKTDLAAKDPEMTAKLSQKVADLISR